MEKDILISLLKANININKIFSQHPLLTAPVISNTEFIGALEKAYAQLQSSVDLFAKIQNDTAKILDYCHKKDIHTISIFDTEYPKKLLAIKDPPLVLFYRGNIDILSNTISIAVIGSRKPTDHGNKIAARFGEVLAENKITVVSGLAEGIDVHGHIGSLAKSGLNIAILPTGMDRIYPKKNAAVYQEILDKGGCIFSEYLPFSTVYKSNFIYRDRLESGISNGIIIVEAAVKSGTMHTADYALSQNKIMGVYVHSAKFSEYKEIGGNKVLLQNPRISPLRYPDSIKHFIHIVKHTPQSMHSYQTTLFHTDFKE